MKKTLWTMAAALALVGCSQDDLMNMENTQVQEQNAIAFSTYVGDNAQSRAAIVDDPYIRANGFTVNAYYTGSNTFEEASADESGETTFQLFMDNTKLTFNPDKGDDGEWTYSPLKYWPNNKGDKLSFFAYAPYKSDRIDILDDNKRWELTFYADADVKHQVDLIYHKANGYESEQGKTINMEKQSVTDKVKFNFQHALSRITFDVKAVVDETDAENGDNLLDGNTRINIKSVQLVKASDDENAAEPFYTTGVLNLASGVWNTDANEGEEIAYQGFCFNGSHFYQAVDEAKTEDATDDVVQLTKFNPEQTLLNEDSYLMIIPQNFAGTDGYRIYIEYDVISEGYDNNNNETPTYDSNTITNCIYSEPLKTDFVAGQAYKFTLLLGMTSVKFEAGVTGWLPETYGEEWMPENSESGEGSEGGNETPENASKLTYRNGKFIIASADDLANARDYINAGATYTIVNGYAVDVIESRSGDGEQYAYSEADYLQTADIDLNKVNWTPIGTYNTYFKGSYDVEKNGDAYYTISNLYVNFSSEESDTYGALFGRIEDAQLYNIHIASCDVAAKYAAAIVSAAYETDGGETVISGCVVGNEFSLAGGNCTITGTSRIAGIVAGGGYITVSNCTSYADVSATDPAEIAGIGCNSNAAYIGCYNYGKVTVDYQGTDRSPSAAGIACCGADYIEDCHNFGVITSKNGAIGGNASGIVSGECRYIYACHNEGTIAGQYASGGISGSLECTDIKACYNVGEVQGTYFSAGIIAQVGYGSGTSENPTTVNFTSCYNTGSCEFAFAGCQDSYKDMIKLNFTNCYYTNADKAVDTDCFTEPGSGATQLTDDNYLWYDSTAKTVLKRLALTDLNQSLGDDFKWSYEPNPEAESNTSSEKHPLILVAN